MRRDAPKWLPAVVFFGFFAVHLVLVLGTFDAVDLEESEYGNVAVAILDGHLDDYATLGTDSSHGDDLMNGAGRRRRTVWSLEVLATPIFAAMGPSFLALKVFTLLLGAFWALCWFGVARAAAPRAPPWMAALLMILPMPLVQRGAISATNTFAHLGSAIFLGASLWLVLQGWTGVLLAGVVAGVGVYQSASLAPMLLGPVFLAWRAGGSPAVAGFVAGMIPGMGLMIGFRDASRDGDLAALLTGMTGGDPMRGEPLPTLVENLRLTALHGPGFARVDPDSLKLVFLQESVGYTVLVLLILALGMRRRSSPEPQARAVRVAVVLSVLAYLAAWANTGFQLDTGYFDGLRYLLPISGVLPVLLLVSLQKLGRLRNGAFALLLLAHVVGFALLFRPAVFPAPWHALHGYEPTVQKQWLQGELDPARIDPDRLGRWARFAGMSAGRTVEPVAEYGPLAALPSRHHLDGAQRGEFWRGFGIALTERLGAAEAPLRPPAGAPPEIRSLIAQGMAMGTAYAGCRQDLRERLLAGGASEADLYWGFGRMDTYCKELWDTPLSEEQRAAWRAGLLRGWQDYGTGPADEAFLRRLYIY